MPNLRPVNLRARLGLIGLMVGCLFAAMFVRLYYLQVLDSGRLAAAATANQVRQVTVQAPRGTILDRSGNLIVDNKTVVAVTVARSVVRGASCGAKLPARYPPVIDRLAQVLGVTAASILQTLGDCRYSPYEPVPIATDVDISKIVYIREHQDQFPGVAVQELSQRDYPDGTAAAHLLGYVGAISPQQLGKLKGAGYQQGDLVGQAGVEKAYEKWLRGQPGVTKLEVDANGRVLGSLGEQRPQPGDAVELTIDLALQKEVDSDLAAEIDKLHHTYDPQAGIYYPAPSGSVIVLDPRNGAVLAMSSFPSYDPSVWVGGISAQQYQALAASPSALINRAVDGLYTPGSTFKLVTATAALNDGLISPGTYIYDPGFFKIPNCTNGCIFHNNESESLGSLNVQTALTASDDVFFYNLGYDFYQQRGRYGPEAIQDVAKQYGLGQPTHWELGGGVVGRVDSPSERLFLHQHYPSAFPNYQWFAGDNVEMAFGQGATVISPLQLADAYAAFANGGTVWEPHVGGQVLDRAGKVVWSFPPQAISHVSLPPVTHQTILAGLEGVTTNRLGTAYGTFLGFPFNQLSVAGKTGTATTPTREPTALFTAFAPADNPQYEVLVVIDQAGFGSSGSAPVARQILEYLAQHPVGPVTAPANPTATPTPAGPTPPGP
ncbi:MAG TPA: penicillin-binding protein 2 [Acidimicrobiales bacterium]|nr:penicillin-binding protein 2 [Acidimicrobiales bacterium]